MTFETGLPLAYLMLLGVLALLGVHRLLLLWSYLRTRHRLPAAAVPLDVWPRVTIQLPVYNEPFVAERLLRAVAAMQYPSERLEIQVLDDSDDGSSDRTAAAVDALRRRGFDAEHLRRGGRRGFKAGALAAGLERASGEFLCIFDADFVPPVDFLRRSIPHFCDEQLGLVQARWGHLNPATSLLTRVQALLLDAHFAIEQAGRSRAGRLFNFNGTAGVWRRAAIESAGGWQQDTLTEDLDLSYRAQLAGWRFLYLGDLAAPALLPVSLGALKTQQHRWTKGAVQTARKLLGRIWRSGLPAALKIEATVHLLAGIAHPVMLGISLLVVPTMVMRHGNDHYWATLVDLGVLAVATGSLSAYFLIGQAALGRPVVAGLLRLPALMALGIGLSVNNTRAVLEGLGGQAGEFVRTPKPGRAAGQPGNDAPIGDGQLAVEMLLAAYFAASTVLAWTLAMWTFLPFVALFLFGYGWVAIGTLRERAGVVAPAGSPARVSA